MSILSKIVLSVSERKKLVAKPIHNFKCPTCSFQGGLGCCRRGIMPALNKQTELGDPDCLLQGSEAALAAS